MNILAEGEKMELKAKAPRDFFSLIKGAAKWAVATVVFIYVFVALAGLAFTFVPKLSLTTSLSQPIIVEGTPSKVFLHITVSSTNTTKTFDASYRANEVLSLLEPNHIYGKPEIKLSMTSFMINHTRYYRLTYTITAQLKDMNIDWERLAKLSDGISMRYTFDDSQYAALEQKAKEKASALLDQRADERGRKMFFIYFGKRLLSEDVSCGRAYFPKSFSPMLMAVEKTQGLSPQPGTEQVRCYVNRKYVLFGIGFAPFGS